MHFIEQSQIHYRIKSRPSGPQFLHLHRHRVQYIASSNPSEPSGEIGHPRYTFPNHKQPTLHHREPIRARARSPNYPRPIRRPRASSPYYTHIYMCIFQRTQKRDTLVTLERAQRHRGQEARRGAANLHRAHPSSRKFGAAAGGPGAKRPLSSSARALHTSLREESDALLLRESDDCIYYWC